MMIANVWQPNIIRSHGHQQSGPGVQIFMDLKECSLEDLVYKQEVPENDLTRDVFHDVLKGLDYLHSEGFIHRDLKPANILCARGERWSFCLADFGLTNAQDQARTICGSAMFAAPEIHFGRTQTAVVDLWSLFVTLAWTNNWEGIRAAKPDGFKAMLSWIASTARLKWNNL